MCALSLTTSIYWIDLGFYKQLYKELILIATTLIILRYSIDEVNVFIFIFIFIFIFYNFMREKERLNFGNNVYISRICK